MGRNAKKIGGMSETVPKHVNMKLSCDAYGGIEMLVTIAHASGSYLTRIKRLAQTAETLATASQSRIPDTQESYCCALSSNCSQLRSNAVVFV